MRRRWPKWIAPRISLGSLFLSIALFSLIGGALYEAWLGTLSPLEQDCWHGRVHSGTPLAEVLAAYPSPDRNDYPPYTSLKYGMTFSGVFLVAKDGVIRTARTYNCSGGRIWFDTLAGEDSVDFETLARRKNDALVASWNTRNAVRAARVFAKTPAERRAVRKGSGTREVRGF